LTPLLELRQVGFQFGSKTVLDRLNLTLEAGTCTALIGPNGVGKTTLLRIISGALPATRGEILLNGQPLHILSAKQRAQRVAMVPQQLDVPFDFTVQQIVEQGRTPYLGMLRGLLREDHAAVDRALDLIDATSLRHRVFNELSGGERQRVKIALGLAQQPTLLLLDEPTQNLDIGRQVELIDLLEHLRIEGITLLASIHDLHLVPGNFSSVLLLAPDKSLTIGTSAEVLTSQLLSDAFQCPQGRHPLLMGAR
jgi:ABC-type cobalamin/Fe3+-siderophores transport system ATPase subunit